jgi:hypothetical protein
MMFEISFADQPAAEAGVLAQELRSALLRSGADPRTVEIIKERADTILAAWSKLRLKLTTQFAQCSTMSRLYSRRQRARELSTTFVRGPIQAFASQLRAARSSS